jgi:hypothetical protein
LEEHSVDEVYKLQRGLTSDFVCEKGNLIELHKLQFFLILKSTLKVNENSCAQTSKKIRNVRKDELYSCQDEIIRNQVIEE